MHEPAATRHTWLTRGSLRLGSAAAGLVVLLWLLVAWALA
jgi:hypothetical protein